MTSLKEKLNDSFEKVVNTENKWFNWKTGLIGGVMSGFVTYFFNDTEGVLDGLQGAFNSFNYVFLTGGLTSKLCENISIRNDKESKAIISSSIIPTTISFGAGYLWHKCFGSAEPFYSIVWSVPINFVSFGAFGKYWYRRDKKRQDSKA